MEVLSSRTATCFRQIALDSACHADPVTDVGQVARAPQRLGHAQRLVSKPVGLPEVAKACQAQGQLGTRTEPGINDEAEQIAKFNETKKIPEFRPGDTLRVGVKVVEGERTRVQNYEGVCIARANRGMGSSFTVRKISFGEGVERVFPLYSPNIDSIEVVRKGIVRRAKLYYLRGRTGKSARIAERRDVRPTDEVAAAE